MSTLDNKTQQLLTTYLMVQQCLCVYVCVCMCGLSSHLFWMLAYTSTPLGKHRYVGESAPVTERRSTGAARVLKILYLYLLNVQQVLLKKYYTAVLVKKKKWDDNTTE